MTEKRYRKIMGLIENNAGETFDLIEIENLLNEQEERIRELEKENKFLNDRIQEYEDGFYIIDNDTGLKLNQDEIIRQLNKYNSMLNEEMTFL